MLLDEAFLVQTIFIIFMNMGYVESLVSVVWYLLIHADW